MRAVPAVLSLGLIRLIGNIIIFGFTAWLVEGFWLKWGVGSAILGAIALTLINFTLFFVLNKTGLVAL